jgi:Na+-translocating ferredoxin:NAD+ oxidoreductase RnfC subunit
VEKEFLVVNDSQEFAKKIKSAGVVGAGGGGFPTYVKAQSRAEIVIMNAAECEPLIKKDQKILEHFPEISIAGLELMMKSVGASQGIIGIKKKHGRIIKNLQELIKQKTNIKIHQLGDFYPAGDEFSLVYEVTGRLVPMGGIPIEVGVVVNNVETLYNTARAEKIPVLEKFLTVAGAVNEPCTVKIPIGTSFAQVIGLAGGLKYKNSVMIDGGPMMGSLVTDFSTPVTKISAGLIVLDKNNPLGIKKNVKTAVFSRIGKSACDQCSFCTELCPRYLLGHAVQPHKVMRSLLFSNADRKIFNEHALLCCECSLCSLYACPENLDPKNVCVTGKSDLRESNVTFKNASIDFKKSFKVNPLREERKVPVSRLIHRLGLTEYNVDAPMKEHDYVPEKVKIPFLQHTGIPAKPVVSVGQKVKKGDLIGTIPEDKLGANVHASIDGKVVSVNEKHVEIVAAEPCSA